MTKDGVNETRDKRLCAAGRKPPPSMRRLGSGAATTLATVQVVGRPTPAFPKSSARRTWVPTQCDPADAGSAATSTARSPMPSSYPRIVKNRPRNPGRHRQRPETRASTTSRSMACDQRTTSAHDSGLPALNHRSRRTGIKEYNIGISSTTCSSRISSAPTSTPSPSRATTRSGHPLRRVPQQRHDPKSGKTANNFKPSKGRMDRWRLTFGPAIEDRLFIFAGYEEFPRSDTLPPRGIVGSKRDQHPADHQAPASTRSMRPTPACSRRG